MEYTDDGGYFLSDGRAIATIEFNGELHHEGCNIDIEPVRFFFELSLKEKNLLNMSGRISWDLVDSDIVVCGLKKGFEFNPYTFVLGGFAGPFGMALFNPLGFATILLGVIYVASTKKPDKIKEKAECTYSDDKTSFVCKYPIPPIDTKICSLQLICNYGYCSTSLQFATVR